MCVCVYVCIKAINNHEQLGFPFHGFYAMRSRVLENS